MKLIKPINIKLIVSLFLTLFVRVAMADKCDDTLAEEAKATKQAAMVESKIIFDNFMSFYQRLPDLLRRQIISFGPGEGFQNLKVGNPVVKHFFLMLNGPSADFIIDESISVPILKDNKVYLPKSLGQYEVNIGAIELHGNAQ